jgi:hypothetical protein
MCSSAELVLAKKAISLYARDMRRYKKPLDKFLTLTKPVCMSRQKAGGTHDIHPNENARLGCGYLVADQAWYI